MTDQLLPTWLRIARVGFKYRDSTGVSIGEFSGFPVTGAKGGDRLTASLDFAPTSSTQSAVERAALIAFLARLRGRQNRAYLYNPAQRLRGSFPATELLTNNTFADVTTGWSSGTGSSLSVADRLLRYTRTQSGSINFLYGPPATVTAFVPYVVRLMMLQGRGLTGSILQLGAGSTAGGFEYGADGLLTTYGMRTFAFSPLTTTAILQAQDSSSGGATAGDYLSVPYTSLSRCALVDNGPNALLRSDELENASWTSTGLSSRVANDGTAPDGTATADALVENSSNSSHRIEQVASRTAAAADLCAYGYFRRSGAGARDVQLRIDSNDSNGASCIFDLGAGTAGSPVNIGTGTNSRAFIVAAGDNWYFCALVVRCSAVASLRVLAYMVSAGSDTYTGDGTSRLLGWRVGGAVSSVPTRGAQTTTTALPTGKPQTGSALHVKGLPASTNGLLLQDDEFEVITSHGSELKIVTAALNSDAAGLGYLQFEPPLRGTPADNAPVIIHQPMMRAIFSGDLVGWDHVPGVITTSSAEFEEA